MYLDLVFTFVSTRVFSCSCTCVWYMLGLEGSLKCHPTEMSILGLEIGSLLVLEFPCGARLAGSLASGICLSVWIYRYRWQCTGDWTWLLTIHGTTLRMKLSPTLLFRFPLATMPWSPMKINIRQTWPVFYFFANRTPPKTDELEIWNWNTIS